MYRPQRAATVVVGGWYGDEGKGKIVSYLAQDFRHVARAGVGPNAGHTVHLNGEAYGLRMVPSGFTNREAQLYIGRGVLVDPSVLLKEIGECGIEERIVVDRLCPVIEQRHIDADRSSYNKETIGSTGTGCGPAQLERTARSHELKFARDIEALQRYTTDVSSFLVAALSRGDAILVEMTQGTMLSVYGFEVDGVLTYHNATSKDTTAGSACADVGIGPTTVRDVIAVYKAIPSRVGPGIFPGELPAEEQQRLRAAGKGEYGTVTGRPRRLGAWTPDVFVLSRRTAQMNGATQLAITKIDAWCGGDRGVREYGKLSQEAHSFVERMEHELQLPVTLIGTGPDIYDIIDRR